MSLPFNLPPMSADGAIPLWLGNGFQVGDKFIQVLQYSANKLGWNDDLTFFHEESAGDQHFIDKASRDHAISQLKNNIRINNPTILEVGCSSGYMLQRIQKAFPDALVIGSDVVHEPLVKLSATVPGIPLLRFDLTCCPLPDNSIDALVMLNVLEHIEDDLTAIKQIYRILKPGGVAIIEVPAGSHLYDFYDKVLLHYKRYNLSQLSKLIKRQGFNINKKSHLGFFLYPGFRIVKKRNQRFLNANEKIQRQLVKNNIKNTGESKLLHAIMQIELALGRWISYPFGIRCLLTCKKTSFIMKE